MVDVTTIETVIADGISQTIGDPTLTGVIAFLLFVLLVIFSGMDLAVGLMILIPLILILASIGLMPYWMIYFAFLGMGVIVALAVRKLWGN